MENSKIYLKLKWKGYKGQGASLRSLFIREELTGHIDSLVSRRHYWSMNSARDNYWMKPLKIKRVL